MLVCVCHSIVRLLEVRQQYRQRGREQEQTQEWERERAAATATMTVSATVTEASPRKHTCADSFRPDCGRMLFVCKSNCSLPTHVPKVPAARPGAAAYAGRGVTAGDCNSDHGFVYDCDCQPAAEAYADSFRSECQRINLLRERMLTAFAGSVSASTLCEIIC